LRDFLSVLESLLESVFSTAALTAALFLLARLRGAFGSSAMYTKSFMCQSFLLWRFSGLKSIRQNLFLLFA
jgi:hypothetical protein